MNENLYLSDRVALVTGASRGIGAAVSKAFAKVGAHVILLSRTQGALQVVYDEIESLGGKASIICMDLCDFDALSKLGPTVAERFGRLDICVANAGLLGRLGPLSHGDMALWQKVMDVNVNANYQLIRTLDPLLQKSDAGRMIFTTSGMGMNPTAFWGGYAVSKAALNMLMEVYAAETQKTNIRVNAIRPGIVKTDMLAEAYPGGYQDGGIKEPEDVIEAFLKLASPTCSRHGEIVSLYDEEES